MQRLEVSSVVRLIYRSLGVKGLKATPESFFLEVIHKLVDRWTKCVCEAGGLCQKIRHKQFL